MEASEGKHTHTHTKNFSKKKGRLPPFTKGKVSEKEAGRQLRGTQTDGAQRSRAPAGWEPAGAIGPGQLSPLSHAVRVI